MSTPATELQVLWPLPIYFVIALVLVAVMVGLSYLLGERHWEHATGEPYEGGIVSTGTSRVRLSAKFYLVAMFFVIFDLEAAFIFSWAIVVDEMGWVGYGEGVLFIAIVAAALIYLWRAGALDWGRASPRAKEDGRGARS